MKKIFANFFLLASATTALANGNMPVDSLSYAAGIFVGDQVVNGMMPMVKKNFESIGIPLDEVTFKKVLLAVLNGEKTDMTAEAAQTMLNSASEKAHREMLAANKAKGDAFLAENKTKKGVQTTASGLQYKVITEGKGAKPTTKDKVTVHYEGRTIDGKVFDSSYKRNEPATFGVTQVIKGWTEALQLMTVGSKWELYIPSELAYGERGAGADIRPNEALIFTVELISITNNNN